MPSEPVRSRSSLPNDAHSGDDDQSDFSAIRESLYATSSQSPAARGDRGDRGGEPLMWRRLTARDKLWRGGAASLVVAIACVVILTHAPLSTLLPLNMTANHPAPTAYPISDLTTFQLTALPLNATHNLTAAVATANDPAQTVYACWSAAPFSPKSHMGQVYLAYHHTADNSYAWTPVHIPLVYSALCALTIDAINPEGILLSVEAAGYENCSLPLLYYSADGGATWAHINWPATTAACHLHLALMRGRLYAWNETSLLPPTPSISPPAGRIITSLLGGNGETHWTPADVALSDVGTITVVGVRPGGGLLAVGDLGSGGATRVLLASGDAGQTWRREGELPGAFPQVYVSSNPFDVAFGGWGRLYELAQATTNGKADGRSSLFLATSHLGDGWQSLSLPPVLNPTETSEDALEVIGEAPGGALLVTRGAISQSIASPGPPAKHLWLWDSPQQRWLLNRDPTPAGQIGFSVSWTQGQATLWVTVLDPTVEPTLYLLSATFANPPTGVQRVAGG